MAESRCAGHVEEQLKSRSPKKGRDTLAGERGFTLIEVLIALFLTAVLLTSVYYTFFSMLESREVISEEFERQREVRRFIDLLGMEIESAYVSGSNKNTLFTGYERGLGAKKFARLEFTYFTHTVVAKDNPAGDLKTVRYSVEEGEEGRTYLFKERWDAFIGLGGKGSFKVEAVEDILGFNATYFNGNSWVKAWQNSTGIGAPEAVKFVLTVRKGEGTEKYTFTSSPRINVVAGAVRRVAPVPKTRRRTLPGAAGMGGGG